MWKSSFEIIVPVVVPPFPQRVPFARRPIRYRSYGQLGNSWERVAETEGTVRGYGTSIGAMDAVSVRSNKGSIGGVVRERTCDAKGDDHARIFKSG